MKRRRQDPGERGGRGEVLFSAALVVSRADRAIAQGAMLVRDGRVAAVGRREDFGVRPDCPVVDFGACAILPGFVNAHAHLEYTALAGRMHPAPFHRWLPEMIAAKRALGEEEIRKGVAAGIAAMRRAGVTTVADVSTYNVSPGMLAESGLRYGIFHEVISVERRAGRAFLEEIAQRCETTERLRPQRPDFVGIAPHAPYTVSLAVLRALRRRFHADEGRRFCLHVGESRSEAACVRSRRGRLWTMLRRVGFYPFDSDPGIAKSLAEFVLCGRAKPGLGDLLVHGAFLTRDDWERLGTDAPGSALVVCPATRVFYRVSPSPVTAAMRNGFAVAIGTDSAATGSDLSPWSEIAAAVRDLGLSAQKTWQMSTEGGALALGFERKRGVLDEGSDADFVVIEKAARGSEPGPDHDRPMGDVHKLLRGVVTRGGCVDRSILGTYVGGELLGVDYEPRTSSSAQVVVQNMCVPVETTG